MAAGDLAIMVPQSLITVVMVVAVYFLILGLLNSRKSPQVLSGGLWEAMLTTLAGLSIALPALRRLD